MAGSSKHYSQASPRIPATLAATVLLFGLSAVAPSPLAANAGTPLLWGAMFHLYLANILAACVETWYIAKQARRFSLPITFAIMLAGNAFSAVLGFFGLLNVPGGGKFLLREDSRLQETVAFALLILLTWIISILVEYPFFRFALARSFSLWSVLRADFLAHCYSYTALLVIYGLFLGIAFAN